MRGIFICKDSSCLCDVISLINEVIVPTNMGAIGRDLFHRAVTSDTFGVVTATNLSFPDTYLHQRPSISVQKDNNKLSNHLHTNQNIIWQTLFASNSMNEVSLSLQVCIYFQMILRHITPLPSTAELAANFYGTNLFLFRRNSLLCTEATWALERSQLRR